MYYTTETMGENGLICLRQTNGKFQRVKQMINVSLIIFKAGIKQEKAYGYELRRPEPRSPSFQ